MSSAIASMVAQMCALPDKDVPRPVRVGSRTLTNAERAMLARMTADGRTTREIGIALKMPPGTVSEFRRVMGILVGPGRHGRRKS